MTNLIGTGFVPRPKDKGGRPRDMRLAELDDRAATDVIGGRFANAREAAIEYLAEYGGTKCVEYTQPIRNNRLKDLASRIQSSIDQILSK